MNQLIQTECIKQQIKQITFEAVMNHFHNNSELVQN